MNRLKSILFENRRFFIGFFCCFLAGLLLLLIKGKAGTFYSLNPYHSRLLDSFFFYLTFLGDGLFSIVVFVILLLLRRYFQAWQVIAAFLLSALVAQGLKILFSMPRPKEFFGPGKYPYFIDGITNSGFNSFPSGHATSVFALATMLALLEKNKRWNILYLPAALLVGYSRIYLGQHFLGDILAGSLVGASLATLVFWFFTGRTRQGHMNREDGGKRGKFYSLKGFL